MYLIMERSILLIILLFQLFPFDSDQLLYSQSLANRYKQFGELIITELSNAPFPHPKRITGYTYDNKSYSFEGHYNDSTVLIFIPAGFKPKKVNDFVIHFHGWNNNVDSVLSQFKLIEQFFESKKNAILIVPQGPKNSPDSFGGKIEEKNIFRKMINEITELLYQKRIINSKNTGNIILSGHSGGYRMISFILMRGGLTDKVKEVFLFDGLYGQIEKYTYWLDHYDGKFIDIYTKDGGTKQESENLMECFNSWKMPYIFKNEIDVSDKDLSSNRIIFIYTDLEHNDVIHCHLHFMKYLKASCLETL
jgi:hypothetical protein